ncbi:MAG: hypothetical protein GKR97_02895 [Rhizobiaceae bacterium]|nr:hypothetical protein [Rhizobiaceae bacterium]
MSSTNGTDTPATPETPNTDQIRKLKSAVDMVRNRQADQRDVVVDLGEAEKARLDLLAGELQPLFEDIDDDDDRFELAVSRGQRPRMWIDMTTFVAMGHDKLSYRLLKDTRMGRIVMAETDDKDKMADIVSEYVAERVLEREKMIEGEWRSMKSAKAATEEIGLEEFEPASAEKDRPAEAAATAIPDAAALAADDESFQNAFAKPKRRTGFALFMLGAVFTLAVVAIVGFLMVPQAI